MHVDNYIWENYDSGNDYAKWVLMHFRLPAVEQSIFRPFMEEKRLFCTYKNKRYRCIGASRLGDIWLTSRFSDSRGYEERVDIEGCSRFSGCPDSWEE